MKLRFAIDHPEYLVQINISGQGSYPFTLTKRDKSWYLDDTTFDDRCNGEYHAHFAFFSG